MQNEYFLRREIKKRNSVSPEKLRRRRLSRPAGFAKTPYQGEPAKRRDSRQRSG